jgi:predicted enzyme related to lactoylglutathione lyase
MQNSPALFWELASHDAEKSIAFFKKVFGWQFKKDEKLALFITPAGNAPGKFPGIIFTLKKAKLPFLTVYIKVDNIEEKARQVVAHGGHIVEPPSTLPSGSHICLFNEPSGVTFAMIQYPPPA